MKAIGWVLTLLAAVLVARSAGATLNPEEYDRARVRAPLAFGGVVLRDAGGQAQVRVEVVERGALSPGMVVVVNYPEHRGQPIMPGPAIYYRRFAPGDRLRIWGAGGPTITIVHGGIDVLYRAPPPKSGGCAACTVGRTRSSALLAPALVLIVLAGTLGGRRLTRRRSPRRPRHSAARS